MSYLSKPKVKYPGIKKNKLGLTVRDYEGGMSTLCAGCGHDSITAALVRAFFELNLPPHKTAKISGIGCSSKTTAYFLSASHGINAVHGRMPALATGANAANRDLNIIGVSGDGDSLSIGLGQFAHAIRRNLNMLYVVENNGVYGLTKGQFSASADIGSTARRGEINEYPPLDPVLLALSLGGTFVARSFSGDKAQLVPLIKAGLSYRGFALIDVISPCVTFNDHEGSTRSYAYTRNHFEEVIHADFLPQASEIIVAYDDVIPVTLHDGSQVVLRKTSPNYSMKTRNAAWSYIQQHHRRGEIVTGLLYVDEAEADLHSHNDSIDQPLYTLPYEKLCPGQEALDELFEAHR
jgi:2-oxoglutarate ferredoxin oxidoreductase subunit beta